MSPYNLIMGIYIARFEVVAELLVKIHAFWSITPWFVCKHFPKF